MGADFFFRCLGIGWRGDAAVDRFGVRGWQDVAAITGEDHSAFTSSDTNIICRSDGFLTSEYMIPILPKLSIKRSCVEISSDNSIIADPNDPTFFVFDDIFELNFMRLWIAHHIDTHGDRSYQ